MIGSLKIKIHSGVIGTLKMVRPIIIAGGIGTRLWPMSSKVMPKQFMKVNSQKSLFQETLSRIASKKFEKPIIVTNIEYKELIEIQLAEEDVEADILYEEIQKNTCPAITLALLSIEEDCSVLVLPADHKFADDDILEKSIDDAHKSIKENIVIFGIKPTSPSSEYGYIKVRNSEDGIEFDSFIEKPTIKVAKQYLSSNEYFWNSGMIFSDKSFLLQKISEHSPDVFNHCSSVSDDLNKTSNSRVILLKDMEKCPSISIDYAVLEKTKQLKFFEIESKWSDMGSWNSFYSEGTKDEHGNVQIGNIFVKDTTNSLIISENKIVSAIGLENIVIIDSNEGLLVSSIEKLHQLKFVKELIEKIDPDKNIIGLSNFRPWGNYVSIFKGTNFQLKLINVNPKSKLSVQSHKKRSEHWIVIKGKASVEIDGKEQSLNENDHCFIPRKSIHSLENKYEESLQILELQYGEYLGEDDIIRYSDIYGRVEE
tara:strand:+ start:28952 stop:30397 length:1446 start_codon:yes stop_codon:yes gene_type:complete